MKSMIIKVISNCGDENQRIDNPEFDQVDFVEKKTGTCYAHVKSTRHKIGTKYQINI